MTRRSCRTRGAATACLALVAALAASACATPRALLDRPEGEADVPAASGRDLALAGLRAWVAGGDASLAERRVGQALQRGEDPWARMAAASLARRRLDESGEVVHLVALVSGAPGHPLAPVAAARLQRLADVSPALARAIEDGLGPAQDGTAGLTALRVRQARAVAAVTLGDRRRAEALRAATGGVSTWTLAGPFGALHALEFDQPFAPELGELPRAISVGAGMPSVPSRALPTPGGAVSLDGEPAGGDIYYLASDAVASRGGDYLLAIRTSAAVKVWIDGSLVAERRAFEAHLPARLFAPVELRAGLHHLLVKVARGPTHGDCNVWLARGDGAATDLAFQATPAGAALPRVSGRARVSRPERDLLAQVEPEAGAVVARWLVAAEASETDPELAKALVAEGLRSAPSSPPLLAQRAEVLAHDPTLSDRVGRSLAKADLDRALSIDRDDAASRVARAYLALVDNQLEEASELLDPLPHGDSASPRSLVARARVARARSVGTLAEQLAEQARRTGSDCAAIDLLFNLPARRDSVAKQDADAEALSRCRNGLEQVADHRRRRGDLRGALEAVEELARETPAAVDVRLLRGALVAAAGRPLDAAADLASLADIWPRDARIERKRAEFLDAGGEAAAARAARERALLLDGSDLGLRRALALDRGGHPLDEWSEDGLEAIARYRAAAPSYTTSTVTVLDFAAVEAHPGGAYTERIHTVVEARDARAVDHVGEVTVPEGAELLIARTIKQDGTVLDAEEPAGDKRSLSLGGLEPGDFAEWEWIRTVPPRGPAVAGYSADAFFFQSDMPLWRSTYVVSAPVDVGLEVDAHHMDPVAPVQEGDRVVLRASRGDVAPLLAEPNSPGDAEQMPFLQIGAGAGAEALARALGDALVDAFRPNRELADLAATVRASARGSAAPPDAILRAAYRRVDELVLGGGGFEEPATQILSRGRGNRTVLLKALLAALGVKARVALVRDVTRDPAPYRFPLPDRFGYAVLRVEHAGQTLWLDPTTRGTPFGVLPPALRGAEALVLPEPGEPVIATRTPAAAPDERHRIAIAIVVDDDGSATVIGREEYRGYEAGSLRASLEPLDAAARRQALEHVLARSFRAPSLAALEFEGEADPEAPLIVRWRARVDRWAQLERGRAVVDAPLVPARLGARFLQREERRRTLLIPQDERTSAAAVIRLPAGWTPSAAPAVELRGPWGAYTRRERVEAGQLVRDDTFDLRGGRIAPGEYAEFARFGRAVDAAQQRPMVFERPVERDHRELDATQR